MFILFDSLQVLSTMPRKIRNNQNLERKQFTNRVKLELRHFFLLCQQKKCLHQLASLY